MILSTYGQDNTNESEREESMDKCAVRKRSVSPHQSRSYEVEGKFIRSYYKINKIT